MNIFAVAWNLPKLNASRIRSELYRMADIYPSLDKDSIWTDSSGGQFALGCISSPHNTANPRVYSARDSSGIALYSGLPVDRKGEVPVHDSNVLLSNWEHVRERLEGTYAIVRLVESQPKLEIQTDILGGEQVYYTQHSGGWLISNSVLLLERLTLFRTLDTLGVSMYLYLGHVLGDRTLRDGIRVMPGGQRWIWVADDRSPTRVDYYPLSCLARRNRERISPAFISKLATDLQQPLLALEKHFDTFVCPLTGGKDSRVVASLLIASGIDAHYFTFGSAQGDDTLIASEIANRFGLPYTFLEIDARTVLSTWDDHVSSSIRATDGMRSLYLLAGLAKSRPLSENSLDIYLWGACGELARAYYGDVVFGQRKLTLQDIKDKLSYNGSADPLELLHAETASRARAWRDEVLDKIADSGFELEDIGDIYGNHIVDARRLGNNGRGLAEIRDTYSPFASRAFFEATLSLDPRQRLTEPLHFNLTKFLTPELHSFRLAKDGWRTQNPSAYLLEMRLKRNIKKVARKVAAIKGRISHPAPKYYYMDSMFDRLAWLEQRREHLLELSLDAPASAIWDFVSRDRFEEIMSPATHSSVRSRGLRSLLHIATLAYYENDTERLSVPSPVRHTSTVT